MRFALVQLAFMKEAHIMKIRRIPTVLLAFTLAFAIPFPIALADMAPDPGVVYEVNYKVEGGEGRTAYIAEYTYYVHSGQLAKNAVVYEKASRSSTKLGNVKAGSWMTVLEGYQDLPRKYQNTDAEESESFTPVLYKGSLGYALRKDFIPKGQKQPRFYALEVSEKGKQYYAVAKQDITVYSQPGKGKKLGTISKDSMAMPASTEAKGYLRVIVGPDMGYVRTNTLKVLSKEKLDLAVGKAAGTYLEPVDWNYGGRVSAERRAQSGRLFNGFGTERSFNLIPNVYNDEMIFEFQMPTQAQTDKIRQELIKDGTVTLYDTDTIETLEFDTSVSPTVYCYQNGKIIICYQGSDPEMLTIMEETHGRPFHVIEA